jgi:hypothetical protein
MRPSLSALSIAVAAVAGCGVGDRNHGVPPGGANDMSTTTSGGNDAGPTMPAGPTFATQCNGAATTLSGTVVAPNGADPVPNAFVYVPVSAGSFPNGVSCELCGMPIDGASATANSGPDGTFKLDLSALPPSSSVRFTVNIGRFRRSGTVNVTACQDNPISAPATQLPGKPTPGVDDIPRIAVATGNKDQLDAVLVAMGLDKDVGFDCFEGRKTSTKSVTSPCGAKGALPAIETLLTDENKLETYNMLFLSCAPGKFAALAATDQMKIAANLQTWTGKGGRLFVTDNSYDYVAQAFPSAATFLGANGTVDSANVGVGGSSTMPTQYSGQINDPTLAAWLAAVKALPAGTNTLPLDGYLNHWSVIASVPSTTVDVVDATNAQAYPSTTSTMAGPAMSYPQSVKFDITPTGGSQACGRAIYTSYHTLPSTQMVSSTQLAPQERILEYLMFEAGACVGPIG